MALYTLEQINSDVAQAFANYPHSQDGYLYNEPYFSFFFILNRYGMRYNELKAGASYVRISDTEVRVPLSKNQDYRILTETEHNIDRLLYTIQYYEFFTFINNSTASRLFNRFLNKRVYLETGKDITTHFFRHKLCKNLFAEGMTVPQISAYIGEVNRNNITGYINSVMYFDRLRF